MSYNHLSNKEKEIIREMREKDSVVASPPPITPSNLHENPRMKTSQAMRTEYNKRDEEREHMREIKEKQDKIKLFGKDSDSNVQSNTLYPSNNSK